MGDYGHIGDGMVVFAYAAFGLAGMSLGLGADVVLALASYPWPWLLLPPVVGIFSGFALLRVLSGPL